MQPKDGPLPLWPAHEPVYRSGRVLPAHRYKSHPGPQAVLRVSSLSLGGFHGSYCGSRDTGAGAGSGSAAGAGKGAATGSGPSWVHTFRPASSGTSTAPEAGLAASQASRTPATPAHRSSNIVPSSSTVTRISSWGSSTCSTVDPSGFRYKTLAFLPASGDVTARPNRHHWPDRRRWSRRSDGRCHRHQSQTR